MAVIKLDSNRNKIVIIVLSAGLLVALASFLLSVGSVYIPLKQVILAIVERAFGVSAADGVVSPTQMVIIWDIRWQRIALAMLVGASLAISGACYQTLFRNPLADPFILGVSSGAAFGAAIAIVLRQTTYITLYAFLGALGSMLLVQALGYKHAHLRSDKLLLAGVACGSLLNALLSCVMALYSQQMSSIMFWLMGSVSNYTQSLLIVAGAALVGFGLLMFYARDLDVMTVGDDSARYLGVDVGRIRLLLLIVTTLVTGVVVSVSGVIGFIGLVVPHLLRAIVGPGHRLLLPLCALWGAIFLLVADGVTRLYLPLAQLPVGVVTALIGSPFFLYILFRANRG